MLSYGRGGQRMASRRDYTAPAVSSGSLFAHVAPRLDLRALQDKMQIRENNCCAVK